MSLENSKPDVSEFRTSIQQFTWCDYAVFVVMLSVCGGIGVFFGCVKKQRSTQDYLMGGRNMKLVPVCFSLVARSTPRISCRLSLRTKYNVARYKKGGLKAVVWTDVIQTLIMVGAIILVIIKGTIIVGGFQEVIKRNWDTGRIELPSLTLDFTERHSILSVSIGSSFYWIGNIAVNQSMVQRFLSLPDLKSSKSGLLAFAKYYDCDPFDSKLTLAKDQLLPLLVMDVLAEWKGMPGIFVCGVFSAALSSLSTGLNSMAAVVLEDFWKPFFKKLTQRQTQVLMRAVVVILGIICVGLVFVVEMLGSVLQLTMSLSSASMGPLAGVFLMGIFLPFINSTNALMGGILGLSSSWYLVAQSQVAQAQGSLKFIEKPRFTLNCTYSFEQNVISDVSSTR
ncbi:unnamed protein product [Diatraea saccharalis]|uniref:Uncharacterized protein n=1 Tax=Diatraea saccharalis TaxID=40085 RepID=A0A9N9WIM9_9NEOP|nr:unnamed protein product [Diatraea saccharalis]